MFGLGLLPRSLDAALRDVADPRLEVRLAALKDVARYARGGEDRAVSLLLELLTDSESGVRAGAALGLADAGIQSAVARLTALLERETVGEVRQMALLALGELANLEHAAALAALEHAYQDGPAPERFQALLGLHQLGAASAERAIIEGTVDPDAEVRRLSFRIAEAHWSGRQPPELIAARARAALSDSAQAVRAASALLLAHFDDPSGQGVLLALVAGASEARADDEQAAIEAAARLGLRAAIPALERRAFSWFSKDPQAYHARIALARLGHERAKTAILRGLRALTFDTRTLAVAAAGRAGLREARAQIETLRERPERADPSAVHDALALLDEAGQESR